MDWNDLFDDREELVFVAMNLDYSKRELVPKGYGLLESMQEQYKNGKPLSGKQLTDIKRLAKGIYAYANHMENELSLCKRS